MRSRQVLEVIGAVHARAVFTGAPTFSAGVLLVAVAGAAAAFALGGRISIVELISPSPTRLPTGARVDARCVGTVVGTPAGAW